MTLGQQQLEMAECPLLNTKLALPRDRSSTTTRGSQIARAQRSCLGQEYMSVSKLIRVFRWREKASQTAKATSLTPAVNGNLRITCGCEIEYNNPASGDARLTNDKPRAEPKQEQKSEERSTLPGLSLTPD